MPTTAPTTAPTLRPASAGPGPTTVEELCNAQTWPRPVPDVVGRPLYQAARDGALLCWDDVRAVAPDGHDPLNNPVSLEKNYRITAVTPAPGALIGRHEPVTVRLVEVDPAVPPAFRPCDWVTTREAADLVGGPVSASPDGDQAGSIDIGCYYDKVDEPGGGVEVDLRLPGAYPVDAEAQFALAKASKYVNTVGGIGVKAVCVHEPTTTPPSTTLVVLLSGGRLFRITAGYADCDTLKRFAQVALNRIG